MDELAPLLTFTLFMEDQNMNITIDLEDGSGPPKSVIVEVEADEQVETVVARAAAALGIDPTELTTDIGTDSISFESQDRVRDCISHGQRWHCRRVCVEIHYQSEPVIRHSFSPKQKWQRVHEWACKHFTVAAAMCRDLELFAGSPTGPPLNENLPIGASHECKVVWLAKPGPEPNGC